MATSNTYQYIESAGQFIADVTAAQGFTTEGEDLSDYEFDYYQRHLNRIFKNLMAKNAQGVGWHMWQRHIGFMFLSANTGNYQLSNTCPYWTDQFVVTNAVGVNATSQKLLNVASSFTTQYPTNPGSANGQIAIGMSVVLQLDNGSMDYDIITNVVGNQLTLANNLPTSVSGGGVLYAFNTTAQPPQVIEHVSLRDQNGNDLTLDILTKDQYSDNPGKQQPNFRGDPQAVYYEPHLVDNPTSTGFYGSLKTDVAGASDLTKYLVIDYVRELQDITDGSVTLDIPKEFYLAVFWILAKDTIDFAQMEWTQSMQDNYTRAIKLASNSNPKRVAARFVRRGYGGPWRQIPHR